VTSTAFFDKKTTIEPNFPFSIALAAHAVLPAEEDVHIGLFLGCIERDVFAARLDLPLLDLRPSEDDMPLPIVPSGSAPCLRNLRHPCVLSSPESLGRAQTVFPLRFLLGSQATPAPELVSARGFSFLRRCHRLSLFFFV
jgi:hypothetical protein